jgi:hypothetical protein
VKRLIAPSLALILVACGGRQTLKPSQGANLPPKPAAASVTPTPDQLMAPSDQAQPQRSDEVLQRSEKRADDPFDLPPSD